MIGVRAREEVGGLRHSSGDGCRQWRKACRGPGVAQKGLVADGVHWQEGKMGK